MSANGASAGRVDLHNHLMPGVDDGAPDLEASRRGLAAMQAEGIERLAVTPHFDASLTERPDALERRLGELDRGWEALSGLARAEFPRVEVSRAAEVMLDMPEPDLSDPRLRLGGGPFVLVEFPFALSAAFSGPALAAVRSGGWTPVVAHPERYTAIPNLVRTADAWRSAGAYLQVNGLSLLGRYGAEAKASAEALFEAGLVDYLASDFHARGRPLVREYAEALRRACTEEIVELLTRTNPGRILNGETPIPVGAVRLRRHLWQRLIGGWRP
ncbi:MAG TPA: CpsB/CapC family capsule biosynthesis tyrosine phosphatase [Longimicrobiales bacterium]|nr:CpsB/CapC family capsule biosynthesis tyrosine phosphatase [Longimicrobiales bacterium]